MSSSPKVASLTGTLLVAKGGAAASGAASASAAPPRAAAVTRSSHRAAASVKEDGQLSLHLDAPHLRRLRLAAAHLDQSEHAVLIAALEHYIDHVVSPLLDGRCSCLDAERKPRRGTAPLAFGRQKSDLAQ